VLRPSTSINAKADSEKWLILGFTIGVQIPGVVEYFSITRPALDHRHGSKGLGKLYNRDCSSGVTETEAQTEILSKVPCRKLGYLPLRQCTSSQHGTNALVWLIVAYFPLQNRKLK